MTTPLEDILYEQPRKEPETKTESQGLYTKAKGWISNTYQKEKGTGLYKSHVICASAAMAAGATYGYFVGGTLEGALFAVGATAVDTWTYKLTMTAYLTHLESKKGKHTTFGEFANSFAKSFASMQAVEWFYVATLTPVIYAGTEIVGLSPLTAVVVGQAAIIGLFTPVLPPLIHGCDYMYKKCITNGIVKGIKTVLSKRNNSDTPF